MWMTKGDNRNKVTMHEVDDTGFFINKTFNVIWDLEGRRFKINKDPCPEKNAPFMNIHEAHRNIVECFDLMQTTANVPSKPIKVLDASLPTASCTYKLLEHIKRISPYCQKLQQG